MAAKSKSHNSGSHKNQCNVAGKSKSHPFDCHKQHCHVPTHDHHKGHTHPFRNIIILVVFAALIFFGGLYFGGVFDETDVVVEKDTSTKKLAQDSYEEGYQAAIDFTRKRLSDEGVSDELLEPVTFLQAVVKALDGESVVVEFEASELDDTQEGLITKTVSIPSSVFIEWRAPKSEEQIIKEYEELKTDYQNFLIAREENPDQEIEEPSEPLSYTIENLSVSDLAAGDVIRINTESNIRATDSFEATLVSLVFRASLEDEEVVELADPTLDFAEGGDIPSEAPPKNIAELLPVLEVPLDPTLGYAEGPDGDVNLFPIRTYEVVEIEDLPQEVPVPGDPILNALSVPDDLKPVNPFE